MPGSQPYLTQKVLNSSLIPGPSINPLSLSPGRQCWGKSVNPQLQELLSGSTSPLWSDYQLCQKIGQHSGAQSVLCGRTTCLSGDIFQEEVPFSPCLGCLVVCTFHKTSQGQPTPLTQEWFPSFQRIDFRITLYSLSHWIVVMIHLSVYSIRVLFRYSTNMDYLLFTLHVPGLVQTPGVQRGAQQAKYLSMAS